MAGYGYIDDNGGDDDDDGDGGGKEEIFQAKESEK